MKKILRSLRPVIAVALGLALGLSVVAFAGESPLRVFMILLKSAFGSKYDIGMTLFYTTPLLLTGLAVALPLQAGLFNIGAEGQLTLGALACAAFGAAFPNISYPLAPLLGAMCAFFAGALWGLIPGWLRAVRGSHEVINTIMLNFVAAGIASYFTLYIFKNPESQNPETRSIGPGYVLAHGGLFGDAPVSSALLLALLVAFSVWFFLWRTSFGFELRAVGQSIVAASRSGIRSGRVQVLAMVLAGGIAGLVGVGEVLGNAGRFRLGFSPDFGFMGIAVALLARGNIAGVVASSILFGALHKGTADLDFETENVTRDLSLILQALVILVVSADALWEKYSRRLK